MRPDEEILKTADFNVDGNIITLVYYTNLPDHPENIRLSEIFLAKFLETLKQNQAQKFRLFVDLTLLGNVGTMPSKSRQNYAKMSKEKQLERLAVAGGNMALRTIASFIMKLSGLEKKYQWFNTKEEALAWLKS